MQTVRVALLFSTSGVMEQTEKPLMMFGQYCFSRFKAEFARRGLQLEVMEADFGSDTGTLREKIKELERANCRYFFGPYTSLHRRAARKAMTPYSLLFYPVQYEGFDDEGLTWFFGGTPNQQLIPVIDWFASLKSGTEGDQCAYFVGSDYAYPRMVLQILREPAINRGVKLIEPRFLPLDDARPIVEFVKFVRDSKPGLVVNAINGNSNRVLFEEIARFKATGDWPSEIRLVSLSLSDVELLQYSSAACDGSTGTYLAANSFDSQIAESALATSTLASFRRGFQEELKETARRGDPVVPPMLSDAMVNLYSAIDFWSKAFLEDKPGVVVPSPRQVASVLQRLDVSLEGPKGALDFHGIEKHGEKRFFMGELRGGRVKSIVEPFDHVYHALPSLDGDIPPDSGIFAEARRLAADQPGERPRGSSNTFRQKLAAGQIRYETDPGYLFNFPCMDHPAHRVSEIFDAALTCIKDDKDKEEWLDRWGALASAVGVLNCVDPDIKAATNAFKNIAELSAAQIGFATCKLRAIYSRCIPQFPDKQRLYLWDLLDIALSRGASITIDSQPVTEGCRLVAEMAGLGALDVNWEIANTAAIAKALLAFDETNRAGKQDMECAHRVSLYNDGIYYQLQLTLSIRRFDQQTVEKIVLAEEYPTGNLASLICHLRVLEPQLSAVLPPTIKIAPSSDFVDWPSMERFSLSAPVFVFQTQSRPTGISKQVDCVARMTIVLRRGVA